MQLRILTFACFCLLVCAVCGTAQPTRPQDAPPKESQTKDTSAKERAAQTAAESWLALVDANKYSESWEQAAQAFKQAVTKEDWANAVQQARQPVGKLKGRKLQFSQHRDKLEGAPAGEYVLLQYDSSFEAMEKATEIVTLTLEKDGQWRTVGYFVRP